MARRGTPSSTSPPLRRSKRQATRPLRRPAPSPNRASAAMAMPAARKSLPPIASDDRSSPGGTPLTRISLISDRLSESRRPLRWEKYSVPGSGSSFAPRTARVRPGPAAEAVSRGSLEPPFSPRPRSEAWVKEASSGGDRDAPPSVSLFHVKHGVGPERTCSPDSRPACDYTTAFQ